MGRYDFDLITLGAGSGGVRATRLAGGYGARTAIIEKSRVGGTCVMRGCVPKSCWSTPPISPRTSKTHAVSAGPWARRSWTGPP